MKRLALRVVRHRDREAALVLGDALMETQAGKRFVVGEWRTSAETGRHRPVRFLAHRANPQMAEALWGSGITEKVFHVRGRERLYNIDNYARFHTEKQWREIFTMWITPRRDLYAAMVKGRVLNRSIAPGELEWQMIAPSDLLNPIENFAYRVYLVRVPKRRKKPVKTFLFEVHREDTPQTREEHFDEEKQQELFGRDPRRRKRSHAT